MIQIKKLETGDIPIIVTAFQKENWHKSTSLFDAYYQEQQQSERVIWVAYVEGQCAGYITLKWSSLYEPFAQRKIPEIMDLNVLPTFRQQGIGSCLLDTAEKEVITRSPIVGIGVGLYGGSDGGYGAAQRIYVKRSYIPDGLGATYQYERATPGKSYPLDDDLILWFTKKLE